jgi:hypothetical protein
VGILSSLPTGETVVSVYGLFHETVTTGATAIKHFWPLHEGRPNPRKSFSCSGAGRGVEPPRGCPRRILSLILGILQGVASRRNKPQQASYLHTYTGPFEVAMRRSQKQKSWKRTAIKTAT